ncbi:hypothetical protein EXE58_03415 [Nocardioides seonyuensis]|uniref:Carboxypeptidase regulatory-like domain-containing protein n=1 Tax=Nocardioides seonyuensis TaxID=2518371 RepID=A0A4P7IC07_9ACTN|nr:hypothetical protein [Nocardioides seonyuensis]QBX54609.1 hypothetical protein EXE58_03415 [Nocardioides seonyuensis]
MRITRIVASAATAALVGTTLIAVSAPAQATETLTTTTTLELPYLNPEVATMHGDDVIVRGAVTGSDGGSVYKGTVTLFAITSSNPAGAPIATVPASGYLSFPDLKVTESMVLKAVYSGYAATSTYEDNYTPSESVVAELPVTRKVVMKDKGTTLFGKITPDYKRKPIKVEKKVGKKWKKFKTFKTKSSGKFRFKLPAPRRGKWHWRITVKGGNGFVPWQTVGSTYSYRTAAPRVSVD